MRTLPSKWLLTALVLIALMIQPARGVNPDIAAGIRNVPIEPTFYCFPQTYCLLTKDPTQFAAYYDANQQMSVAQRTLGTTNLTITKLNSFVGWDSHNYITMALDRSGYLHVSGNMHAVPLVYFRSSSPLNASTLQPINRMIGTNESQVTYPRFFYTPAGALVFSYRDGVSGNGNTYFNIYNETSTTWSRLLPTDIFDGGGVMNAYPIGPDLGPDGFFHMTWVWRDTSDASTCHDLGYARSRDLVRWETAAASPITLPITINTPGVTVDPIPTNGGIINGSGKAGFDLLGNVVIAYHKYENYTDPAANTELYFARFESGAWNSYQATVGANYWNYRWNISGTGTLVAAITHSALTPRGGEQVIRVSHIVSANSGTWAVDPTTFTLVGTTYPPLTPPNPSAWTSVQSTFPNMGVRWVGDSGSRTFDGESYLLRSETLPSNNDQAWPAPYPTPVTAQVIVNDVPPSFPTGLTATAASSSQINLSWTATAGATSYIVQRATVSGGPYTTVARGLATNSYSDTGLAGGNAYYYVVEAVDTGGKSPSSAQASAVTPVGPPAVPTGLSATHVSSTQINLSWTASLGAASYNIKCATISGGPYATIATGVTATNYSDTGALASVIYYYVVSATSNYGESANSPEVIAADGASEPVANVYVRGGTYADTNFATDTGLTVKLDSPANTRESFLRFNVAGLQNAQTVKLRFIPTWIGGEADTTTLAYEFVSDDTWTESGITWNTKPAGSGIIFQTITGYTVGQIVEVDVTSQAKTKAAGNGLLSVRIYSTVAGESRLLTFGSARDANLSNHPVLAYWNTSISNAGFEVPALASGTYQYRPSGAVWTFYGNSGIQSNGSAWQASTAPEGTQTAFIQKGTSMGAIYQSVNFRAGTFTISFKAARRYSQLQPIKFSVDGVQVGSLISPIDSTFRAYTTGSFTVTAGNHTIRFEATDASADLTTFIDQLTIP